LFSSCNGHFMNGGKLSRTKKLSQADFWGGP
jgi:hypothetical protein